MAQNNAINNRSSTLTVDNLLTVSAGGATITGNSTINGGTVGIGTDNAGNAITIGTGTVARNITIGLSAAAHVVNVGVNNGASSLGLNAGTGNLQAISGGTATIDAAGVVELNSTGGAISIGNDANAQAINIGTGAAARPITIGNTTTTTAVTIDCGTGGVSVGASATAHTTTIGSTNSTSATTIQSGSGALNITSTNGAQTHNSGTGALAISNDASATTVTIATGAAAKTVTVGSTTTTSSLALQYGTSDFTLTSATGTVMSALDTGEITYPLQSAFLAYLASNDVNVTGAGAAYFVGTNVGLTEVFDQNSDFNTNGTFTAPVTGRYQLNANIYITGCTIASSSVLTIVTSNRTYYTALNRVASALDMFHNLSHLCDMDSGDTARIQIQANGEAGNTDDLGGQANLVTAFSGYLAC